MVYAVGDAAAVVTSTGYAVDAVTWAGGAHVDAPGEQVALG